MPLVNCPKCQQALTPEALFCTRCGQSLRHPPRVPRGREIVGGTIGIFVALALVAWWFLSSGIGSGPSIGEDARVHLAAGQIIAAADPTDLETYFRANDVRDQAGVNILVQNGRIFALANNTRVHILSATIGRGQVRVLDGAHAGSAVWLNWDTLVR